MAKRGESLFLQFQIIPMERTCSWTVKGFVSLYLCDSPGVYCISEVLSLGNNILWVRWKATISLGGAWQVLRFLLAARHLEKCKFNCIECN